MAKLLTNASTAMAAWPKSLRHPQTCNPDCGSNGGVAVDGMAAPPNNDMLARQFEEMLDYDELLGLVEGINTALTEATLRLEPLAVHMGRACFQQGCGEGSKLQRLTTQLDQLALSLKNAAPHLEGVQQLIQQSKFHSARARCEFIVRERVRAKQLHCDEQVAALTQRDSAGARQVFSRDEKLARLSARDAACEEFACCTERAERLAGVVLDRKPTTVEAMLTGLCHSIAAYSAGANALSQELSDTSDSTQHHQQQPRRSVVVAEYKEAPQSMAGRLPRMPACDFGCGFLAGLTPWGGDIACCHRQWPHDGTATGVDTLYGSGNPRAHKAPTESRLPLPLPLGL
jgi:hypothetical protein